MIEQTSIERLKEIVDIADVIGGYLPLKRSGSDYVCVCPFHNDKNPSLRVSPSRAIFHCFSCKAGGDAIKFIMDYEKLTYPEAIEKLANLYNFTLSYSDRQKSEVSDKKILENLNLYYKSELYKHQDALSYLYKRGLSDGAIEKWELGWAGASINTLNLLQNEKIKPKEALSVGAVKQNESGFYASFIHRVTFPIYSHLGKLVGFGGRTISDNPAKYINSPQSNLFDKSKILYGYDKAKSEIFKSGEVVICEGYMDCIMMHLAGINNCVAVLGTVLTEKHIPLLKRSNIKVVLSFDSDGAGINAAFKSARLLSLNEIDGRVVLISGGKDPAELILAKRENELKNALKSGVELGEFYITHLIQSLNPQTPLEISKALEQVQEFTKNLKSIVADAYAPLVASLLNLSLSSFALSGGVKRPMILNLALKSGNGDSGAGKRDLLELEILKNMLLNPEILDIVKDECGSEMFSTHTSTYKAVVGSRNENNPYIRELNLDNSFEIYKDFDRLKKAITILKINFCDRTIAALANSKDDNKFKKIAKIQNIKKQLKK